MVWVEASVLGLMAALPNIQNSKSSGQVATLCALKD
jgi:hypothetical protein